MWLPQILHRIQPTASSRWDSCAPIKRQSGQSGWHFRADSLLRAAALDSPDNFQFPPCCTLKPTQRTETPFSNNSQLLLLLRMTDDRNGWRIIQSGLLLLVCGQCRWHPPPPLLSLLANPLPGGVSKVSPSAPLPAGALCWVTVLRGEQWLTSITGLASLLLCTCVCVFRSIYFNPAVQ